MNSIKFSTYRQEFSTDYQMEIVAVHKFISVLGYVDTNQQFRLVACGKLCNFCILYRQPLEEGYAGQFMAGSFG